MISQPWSMFTAFRNWFGRIRAPRKRGKKPVPSKLYLEQLEDRTVPAIADLTAVSGFTFTNGGRVELLNQQPAGSGVIDSFVRLHDLGPDDTKTPEGHNTSGRNQGAPKLNFDENSSPVFTHDLQLQDIPKVHIPGQGGGWFREFRLDINDPNNAGAPPTSLNKVKIFSKSTGGALATPTNLAPALGTMLYDLDFGTAGTNTLSGPDTNDAPLPGPSNGNWVNLYDRNHGSGQADMRLLVPESYFNGVSNTSYIYFYSRFGDTQVMTGGYEEWYVGPTQREEAVRVVTRIDRELPGGGEQQGPTDGSVFIVPFASTVHDHAFVTAADGSGTPTGQVIYSFWNNPDCAGDPIYTSPPLAIGTQSASQGPLFAGDYSFAARYLGDSNFSPGLSECEPLHVNRGVSGLDYRVTTNIHDADHNVVLSVPLGTTVHDEATVTPALTTYPRPTGTVTFTFYRNAECFGPGEAAGTVTLSVAAANTAIAHPSTAFGPLGAGSYSFFAHYNGDTQYDPGDGPCEPLTVNKADTRTETQVHNASHQDITNTIVLFGTLIHDQATVTNIGPGGGFAITGNVRFDLYDTLNCTGPVSGTWTVAIGSSGAPDGTATPAIPAPSGFHSFCATYLGDGNYNGSTSAPEPFTVLDDQNGKTPGFWQNPVGNPLINEDDLAELRSLCLVNDDGSDFDPTTREQVAAWITSQANENMAYKLSSFLAAMTLNVNHGFNWEGLVYSPQFGNTGPNGDFILLSELLEMVNDELCDHPYTPNDTNDPGNAFRAYQASLKDLLDALCNNQPLFLP